MLKKTLFLLVLVCFIACEPIMTALSGEKPRIEIKNNKAHINGVLGKAFYKKFVKFINENPTIKDLVLENIPGSVNDEWNAKSCILLHQKGMNTILEPTSVIASGGVDLFIAGNKRTIAQGAKIGVHSWRDLTKDGAEYPKSSEEHDLFLDFFEKIEMDTAFYWYTLRAAPGKDIHWMTEEEIGFYHLRK